jgi:hypothetical protein
MAALGQTLHCDARARRIVLEGGAHDRIVELREALIVDKERGVVASKN